jgi:hypothetical protein
MRDVVDHELVNGGAIRDIAGQAQLSKSLVHRHKQTHVPAVVANSKQAREVLRGDGLASEGIAVLDKAASLLKDAEARGTGETPSRRYGNAERASNY